MSVWEPSTGADATSIQGIPVSSVAPTNGQELVLVGGSWTPSSETGAVASVGATDASIVVTGTASNPTLATGTLDVIANLHAPTAAVALNAQKITGLANGTVATDGAAFGQIPTTFVAAITADDPSIVIGGTASNPTVETGTLDVVATQQPPVASVPFNNQKITGLANGTVATDGAAFGQLAAYAPLANPALTGTPTAPTQATGDNSTLLATDQFVTTAITNAIAAVNPAVAVLVATTLASNTSGLTYNNGIAGIGATLTGAVNTALTFDGVTLTAVGQRVLVKNDTQAPSGAFNGVYFLSVLQTVALAPVLTRALDYDAPSDINNTGAIPVQSGTATGGNSYLLTSQVVTVGTSPLTYIQFTSSVACVPLSTVTTAGDLIIGTGAGTVGRLADVAVGRVLSSGGVGVAPAWAVPSAGALSYLSGTLAADVAIPGTADTLIMTTASLAIGTWLLNIDVLSNSSSASFTNVTAALGTATATFGGAPNGTCSKINAVSIPVTVFVIVTVAGTVIVNGSCYGGAGLISKNDPINGRISTGWTAVKVA